VFSVLRGVGRFAGVSAQAGLIMTCKRINKEFYGKDVDPADLLVSTQDKSRTWHRVNSRLRTVGVPCRSRTRDYLLVARRHQTSRVAMAGRLGFQEVPGRHGEVGSSDTFFSTFCVTAFVVLYIRQLLGA
jgi:hypothetical protein